VYIGTFSKGKRHGQGRYTWTNGDSYEGEWREGKPNGLGKVTYGKGGSYTGELSAGQLNGRGIFEKPDGTKYEGIWLNGVLNEKVEQTAVTSDVNLDIQTSSVNRNPMGNTAGPKKPKSSKRQKNGGKSVNKPSS